MAAGDIVRWISNSSNDWATAANWSTGVVPAIGEKVLFDGGGLANVTGGDFSSTYQLRSITTQPDYTGNIGASGNPLIHNIDSVSANPDAFLTIRGTGDFYWQAGGAGVGGDENYSALVDTAGNGTVFLDSDTATGSGLYIHVKSGNVTISAALAGALTLSSPRARVTLNEHATGPAYITLWKGTLTSARTLDTGGGTYVAHGGTWTQTALISNGFVNIGPHGRLNYKPPSAVTTGNTLMHCDGVLDLSDSRYTAAWSGFTKGLYARIIGGSKQKPSADPVTALLNVDLREEYPHQDI